MKPFNKEKCEKKEMKIGDIAMHGDVVIERIEDLPGRFETLEKEKNNCLAYGEISGHLHQLSQGDFDLRINDENPSERLFLIKTPTSLKHQEHKEILLPPGNYRSRIQREYDPFTKRIREVAD